MAKAVGFLPGDREDMDWVPGPAVLWRVHLESEPAVDGGSVSAP